MSEYTGDILSAFRPFEEMMRTAGSHPLVISMFKRNFLQLRSGATGNITRAQIDPVDAVPDAEELTGYADQGRDALGRTVVIKLNGGLGTSMGLERTKSLIPVRDKLRFIDIIVRQIEHLRAYSGHPVSLLLMNSEHTRAETLAALAAYPAIAGDFPLDFLQHRVPRILAEGFVPVHAAVPPDAAWSPAGHGDIYTALATSGLLARFLDKGMEYAFISNADNLGAVLDPEILGFFAAQRLPFLMEGADRTPADRKGGHLARLKDGRLTLRESAQCPDDEAEEFQDITRYRYFNTNSLWVNLGALHALLTRYDNILPLPLIRNQKTLDVRDPDSPTVFQLETAMGAAISLFDRAAAVRVPRSRFAPVKTTDDLLAIRSDAYILTDDHRLVPNPARTLPHLDVTLDRRYYKIISDLDLRFPHGAPSLLECASLRIDGDVRFGAGVVCRGDVWLRADDGAVRTVADHTILDAHVTRESV